MRCTKLILASGFIVLAGTIVIPVNRAVNYHAVNSGPSTFQAADGAPMPPPPRESAAVLMADGAPMPPPPRESTTVIMADGAPMPPPPRVETGSPQVS